MSKLFIIVGAIVTTLLTSSVLSIRVSETERIKNWHNNSKNTWPPTWQPERSQFTIKMNQREDELQMLPGSNERWENYMQYTQSRLLPRFTDVGFEVIDIPHDVFNKLRDHVQHEIDSNWDHIPHERLINGVYTPMASKFINMNEINWDVLRQLQTIHEEWAGGIKLIPTSAYGVRLYQNGSSLMMHYDKPNTHVISSIVHIAHEYDNDDEPWPIEIEDHDGVLHAVSLEPGQMLFYESAVCAHGRRQLLKGRYYGSLFLHYQPIDPSIWNYDIDDIIAHVPPHWRDNVIEDVGSRWAGQGLTIDSLIAAGAPPRVIDGNVVEDIRDFYQQLKESISSSSSDSADL